MGDESNGRMFLADAEGAVAEFLAQARASKALTIRLSGRPVGDEQYQATFNLVGLSQHLDEYADLCETKE